MSEEYLNGLFDGLELALNALLEEAEQEGLFEEDLIVDEDPVVEFDEELWNDHHKWVESMLEDEDESSD